MGKKLICATVIGTALVLIVAASALGKREVAYVGNLFLADNGGVLPSKLPRHEQAPVSAYISGEIGTVDGTHPPAVKTIKLDIDKTIQVDAKGLPVCRYGQLTNRPTAAAKGACPHAIVGSGNGAVEVAFPDQKPFTGMGQIVAFNGGVHNGTTLLLFHAYVSIPAPTAVVIKTKISRIHSGHYGLRTLTQIPPLAAGDGSATKFKFTLGRRFTYRGVKKSYLTASCPTGHYYARGRVLFSDGTFWGIPTFCPAPPRGSAGARRALTRRPARNAPAWRRDQRRTGCPPLPVS